MLVNYSVSVLTLYEEGAQRILTNEINMGICNCPHSVNVDSLFRAQKKIRNSLLHYIQDFRLIVKTLSISLDNMIVKCLNNYQNEIQCSSDETRNKRSVFSMFDSSDDMRQVSQIFNNNFKKIEKTENAKGKLLRILRQQLLSDKLQLKNIVKNTNAYYVLENVHFECIEMTNDLWSMMQLLSHQFEHSNIRNILKIVS